MQKALKETYHRKIIPFYRRDPTTAEDDSQNPAKADEDHQKAYSFLCKRCSKIDLNQILSLKIISVKGHHIRTFRSASEIVKNPNCSLCQAFNFISPCSLMKPGHHLSYSLMAVHSTDTSRLEPLNAEKDVFPEDSIFLMIKVKEQSKACIWRMGRAGSHAYTGCPGCLVLLSAISALRKEGDLFMADSIGSTVDFNMLRGWINTCEKKHGDYCAPSSTQNSTLRLIECNSRRVVATPKSPEVSTYAALSYVWGSQEPDDFCLEKLPKQLPKTIEDAITVTKGLGIPYLWIDRYCINQNNEHEKHNQCSLMHRIYENAHITIIAAAGDGPDHGLPGIGSSKRSYPSVRIGSHLFVPTLPGPRLSIQAAKWSTRGWTYQESQLSKRKLIFTDRQVLFLCRRACTDEAEQKLKPDTELPDGVSRRGTSLSPFIMTEKSPDMIWSEINRFLKLDLSRQEDCLNAMLGILQRYQESDWGDGVHLRHLAGLPVVKKALSNRKGLENHEHSTWTPAICESLGWSIARAIERRDLPYPGFPSWSWTAWKATELRSPGLQRHFSRDSSNWNISIILEYPDGDLVEGNELDSLLEAGHDFSRIRFIHLKAPSLNFTIFLRRPWLKYCVPPEAIRCSRNLRCVVRHHDTDFFRSVELTDLGVHIPKDGLCCWGIMILEDPWRFSDSLFLLVTKVKDWYERIGVAEVHKMEVLQELETRTFRLG